MITEAIKNLLPNAKFHIYGNFTYDDIEWQDSRPKPSKAEIEDEVARLEAEYDANQYQRDRATDYPTWQEQMDLIYHSGVEGLKAELKKTKDKYPKG